MENEDSSLEKWWFWGEQVRRGRSAGVAGGWVGRAVSKQRAADAAGRAQAGCDYGSGSKEGGADRSACRLVCESFILYIHAGD